MTSEGTTDDGSEGITDDEKIIPDQAPDNDNVLIYVIVGLVALVLLLSCMVVIVFLKRIINNKVTSVGRDISCKKPAAFKFSISTSIFEGLATHTRVSGGMGMFLTKWGCGFKQLGCNQRVWHVFMKYSGPLHISQGNPLSEPG